MHPWEAYGDANARQENILMIGLEISFVLFEFEKRGNANLQNKM